jgi:hypothetical protein
MSKVTKSQIRKCNNIEQVASLTGLTVGLLTDFMNEIPLREKDRLAVFVDKVHDFYTTVQPEIVEVKKPEPVKAISKEELEACESLVEVSRKTNIPLGVLVDIQFKLEHPEVIVSPYGYTPPASEFTLDNLYAEISKVVETK